MDKSRIQNAKETLGTWLDLPADVMMNWPRVSLLGKRQVHLENHMGILRYGDDMVCIATSLGMLEIHGHNMLLRSIGDQEIVITGDLTGVAYE